MRALLICTIVTVVTCVAVFHFGTQATIRELRELSSELRKEATPEMDPLTTTWTSEGPLKHEVRTDWKEGDTFDLQTQRHAQRVASMKAAFPPIG